MELFIGHAAGNKFQLPAWPVEEITSSAATVDFFSNNHERKLIMQKLMQSTMRFLRDEEGVVAIEYGMMAVLIALAIAVGASALGTGLNTMFKNIAACFATTAGGACPVTLPTPF